MELFNENIMVDDVILFIFFYCGGIVLKTGYIIHVFTDIVSYLKKKRLIFENNISF